MLLSVLSIVIAGVIGYCLLGLLSSTGTEAPAALPPLLQVSAGVGLGLGITSLFFFGWCVVSGSSSRGHIMIDIAAAVVLAVLLYVKTRRRPAPAPTPVVNAQPLIPVAFAVFCLAAVGPFLQRVLFAPDGNWDAWSIWDLRARFLYLGHTHWANAFSPLLGSWAHVDYPLLMPATVARGWSYLGAAGVIVPVLIAFCCLLGVATTVFAALSRVRTPLLGLLASGVLLLTPFFVKISAWLYADVPLGWFFVLAVIFGYLYDLDRANDRPRHYGTLVMAGLALGCALWTKNEGELFLVCYLAARGLRALAERRGKAGLIEAGYLLLGALPFLLAALYFKRAFPAENDLLAGQHLGAIVAKLGDPSRYAVIIQHWLGIILSSSSWRYLHLLLLAALFAFGINLTGRATVVLTPVWAILLAVVGYLVIFLITPHDLDWQLLHSLNRLFAQFYPMTVFTLFTLMRIPDDGAAAT